VAGDIATIIIFLGLLFLVALVIYFAQTMDGNEYSEYREKVSEYEKKYPVWGKVHRVGLLKPIAVIFGPSFPRFEKNKPKKE
tara:strand:+ start:680 stop:925 length:246 start_codon:yes stop_codon:yes gene_type:complete